MNFENIKSINIRHSVTDIKDNEFMFVWEIRNFKSYDIKRRRELVSPGFFLGGDRKPNWNIVITESEEHLSFDLRINADGPGKYATFILSICGQENEKISKEATLSAMLYDNSELRSISNFVGIGHLLDEKNKLLVNGNLTVTCRLYYQDILHRNQIEQHNFCMNSEEPYVLKTLFEHKKLSDVKIVIGQKEFEAHKCILAARRRVFSAMFEHDMLEKNESKIIIEDIDAKVMEEVLRFIYCEKMNDGEPVTDIFVAANKYELEELKIICENKLFNSLNGENVGEMLIFADRYEAEKLKKHALNFILTRAKDINFEKFKTHAELYSPLLVELVRESNQ